MGGFLGDHVDQRRIIKSTWAFMYKGALNILMGMCHVGSEGPL